MLTMKSHGVEFSITRGVEAIVCAQIPCLFLFFFYHAFFVFRYKKLRAVLGMERTKPINQNK